MSWWHKTQSGFLALFRQEKPDRETDNEPRFHREMRTREKIEARTNPAEAQYAAARILGGIEQVKEACRDLRGMGWVEILWRDVRCRGRMLMRNPGFSALAALALALGVGANPTVSIFLDRVLVRTLPVSKPHEPARVEFRFQPSGGTDDCFNRPLCVIYGVVSYAVAQQVREYGVRMALGAQRADLLRLVLRQALWLVLVGLGIGLLGSVAVTAVRQSLLFQVGAFDPVALVAVSAFLGSVALRASYLPARHAAKIDPMAALRYEPDPVLDLVSVRPRWPGSIYCSHANRFPVSFV